MGKRRTFTEAQLRIIAETRDDAVADLAVHALELRRALKPFAFDHDLLLVCETSRMPFIKMRDINRARRLLSPPRAAPARRKGRK